MSNQSFSARIRMLLPHYLIMIVLMLLVLTGLDLVFGGIGFWPSIGVAIVVAIIYPFALRRLGRAPEPWQ